MQVDLLIVNYNTAWHLKRLLEVLNSDYEPGVWNLYVQDNGSTDESREWLFNNFMNYNVTKMEFAANVGYARGINHLAAISSSEILAACNADVWFTTEHVKQAIQSFQNNPEQGIMGPKQMDEQGHIRHGGIFWGGRGGPGPKHRGWGESDPKNRAIRDRQQCWTVSGSIYYARRSVWDELTNCEAYRELDSAGEGAFLNTPHYFEETFCSVHAQQHGHQVWYDGTIETAGHTWHASEMVGESSAKFFQKSREIYIDACNKLGIEHEC